MRDNLFKKNQTFIIAEIGNNHEGNFKQAKKLIIEAWKCGVSAVKLQYIDPEKLFGDKKQIKKYERFRFSKKQMIDLIKFAKKKRILIFWTFFDFENFDFYKSKLKLFKISSTDNNFFYFIKKIIKEKKQTFISLGMLDRIKIHKLIKFLRKIDKNCHKYISLLHCSSSYPLKNSEANLSQILYLKNKYAEFKIGYSDHTIGIDASITAISLGAKIIEKHFTIDKKKSKFRDHIISANIDEMKNIVSKSKIINDLLKNNDFKKSEQYFNAKLFRRFVFLKDKRKYRKKIKIDDLLFLRSKGNLSVENLEKIIGKKSSQLKKKL